MAIAGPNGGGKTTLVRIILGLERRAPARRSSSASPRTGSRDRRALGYLAQRSEVGGDAPATVREVVSAGRLASGRLVGTSSPRGPRARRRRDRPGRPRRRRGHPAADAVGWDAAARVHREGARRAPDAARARRADDGRRRGVAGVARGAAQRSPPRARRDDRLRLARVRRGRALRRAARARPAHDRLRRLARTTFRASGTTRVTSMLESEFMRLAFAAGRDRRRARAGGRASSSCSGGSRSSATASGTSPSPASRPASCSASRRC